MNIDETTSKYVPTFRNDDHFLQWHILETMHWFRARINRFLTPYKLTYQQFMVLMIVYQNTSNKRYTTKEVSKRMTGAYADTSRVVERLMSKRLLRKTRNHADERKVNIYLTIRGKQLAEKIYGNIEKLDAITETLSNVEKKWLVDLLQKLKK